MLATNRYDRAKNNVAAAAIFQVLDAHPEYWDAVSFYPREPTKPDTFQEFLRVWSLSCPDNVRPFVATLAARFGQQ